MTAPFLRVSGVYSDWIQVFMMESVIFRVPPMQKAAEKPE